MALSPTLMQKKEKEARDMIVLASGLLGIVESRRTM
jgi:hypothetical protein